jgi:hypothetical protein
MLTQDEVNAAVRGFRPAAVAPHLRGLDDTWVKNHVEDPRADELYKATQQNSITLKDAGAGLLRADIAALREKAGRNA